MKATNNNFETVQTHATVTEKSSSKFSRFINKVETKFDCFFQNKKPAVSRFFDEQLPHACKQANRYIGRLCKACRNTIRGCVNMAVKLSVIAIALMMLYSFAQANPEVWAQIVSTGDAIVDGAHDVAMNFIEALEAPFVFMKNIFK